MRALSLPVTALLLSACGFPEVASSEDVSSRDLQIYLDAVNTGDGLMVTVELESGVGDPRLTGGDALRLTAGGEVLTLPVVEDDADGIKYGVNAGEVSGSLVLDVVRRLDQSALGLTTPVPPPFTLAVAPVTSSQPITVTWDPGVGTYGIGLTVSGDCIGTLSRVLSEDAGVYTIAVAELHHVSPGAAATCPLTVTMTRTYPQGYVPVLPTMPSGYFYSGSTQTRSVQATWAP
jgi:hypothetical protein